MSHGTRRATGHAGRYAFLLLICLASWGGCELQPMLRQVENGTFGRDPHAFATAREMYLAPPAAVWDARGAELVLQLTNRLRTTPAVQHSPAPDDWWLGLAELNRYRSHPEVQQTIPAWADRCAADCRQQSVAAPENLFTTGNQFYRERKFGAASQAYAEVLYFCPLHLDARNNLALAQLHKGNDLIAQLQWEILRRLSRNYVPARINLTVIYERLGQREQAVAMAHEALQLGAEVPAAVFNAAWLKDLSGDHAGAEALLRPMAELEINPKLTEFHKLLQRKVKK